MKKYRNSILILLVAVLSISVFYINQAFSSSTLPDFYVKQINGDAKILDTLSLEADYQVGGFTETFNVTKEGATYRSELPFFEQVDYGEKYLETAELKDLANQYSSFMRGKIYSNQLYNDTNQVIFVDSKYDFSTRHGMHNFSLKIDQLNKKTEDTTSFEVNLPNQEYSSFIEILDVQISTNELFVMTRSNSKDGTEILQEYTINLKKEKLIDDNSILTTEQSTDQQDIYITSLTDTNPTQARTHFTFQIDKTIHTDENSQTVSRDLYVYNYKTKKLDRLTLPSDLTKQLLQEDGSSFNIAYDQTSLYVSAIKDENGKKIVAMVTYDFEKQKITKDHKIQVNSEMFDHNINVYHNKMILTYRGEKNKPYISIFNFEDGKSIFEGTIETKSNDQKIDYMDLYLYQIIGL
ncbi:hypothetical protein F7984_13020 [Pradoshia sp. D12]|uniref:hypothetical protein n=1 Tax=Bacillaceae TaxID=186817 RepID=UPI00111E46E7|nr:MULTISPECIES: hypothetical protein [Bacillaceae]QFK72088.1 hypothetical protein F7984_13020 [Pradoshia sp. D12]TPF71420.1 hypothetical protein FHY44_13180 [Bacillus sp. D12]